MDGVVGQLYHNYSNILANRGPFVEHAVFRTPATLPLRPNPSRGRKRVFCSSTVCGNQLLLAGADNHTFQSSANRALTAGRGRIEFDPVVGHHLASIERGITRAHDLPAQPPFHHSPVLALLAGGKGRRPVTSDVCDARHAARYLKACGAVPDEIARMETAVRSVLVENRHQFINSKISIQRMGGLRVARWMCDDFQLYRVGGFQGLARWCVALMGFAVDNGEASGKIFRQRADAPLLLQNCRRIVETLNSHLFLQLAVSASASIYQTGPGICPPGNVTGTSFSL